MSKHISRNETWFEISNKKFIGPNGYVELNKYGMWDAMIVFNQRIALRKGEPKAERTFQKITRKCGEHKRAREAMMAVENAAKKMKAENNPDKIL